MARSTAQFEGLEVGAHRLKLLAASDLEVDETLHIGDWVRVEIEGPITRVEFEKAKDGEVRRHHSVGTKSAHIEHIEPPDDGQDALPLEGKENPE